MKTKSVQITLFIFFFILVTFGLRSIFLSQNEHNRRVFFAMDTFFEINSPEKHNWDEIETEIKANIDHLDSLINSYNPESEISQINRNAGIRPTVISSETYSLLQQAINLCQLSEGWFDITFQPIQDLYGFETGNYHIPDDQEIEQALSLTGYSHIVFDDLSRSVFLPLPGMIINFSGLIKGITLDRVHNLLISKGMTQFTLNFGGNLYIQSSKEETIGIKSPYNNEIIRDLPIKIGFVSTSSNGEQYFVQNEQRYSHIVNPFDGTAASVNDSVTIISNSGILSDFLSTYLYLLPVEKTKYFMIEHYPKTGFVVMQNKKIVIEKVPEF